MKKIHFLNLLYFRALVIVLYAFVLWEITILSRQITIEDVKANYLNSIDFEIDLCYPLNLLNDTYEVEEDNTINYIPKAEFDETCNFEHPLAHYTKDFKSKNTQEIIEKFKKCKIENLTPVNLNEQTANNLINYEIDWLLYSSKICLKHKFELTKNGTRREDEFRIQSQNYVQNFDVYISIVSYENEIYRSVKKHLFKRNCWIVKNEKKCLETEKGLIFGINYFSIASLQAPFVSDCVNRANSTNQECYELCVKKERTHYLLTYAKDDNFKLDYGDFKSLESLSKKCSLKCSQQDCKTTAFYVESIKETREDSVIIRQERPTKIARFPIRNNDSSEIDNENSTTDIYETTTEDSRNNDPIEIELNPFIIKAKNAHFRIETLPLFRKPKVVWMILVTMSVFYGLDIYGLLTRTTEIYQNAVKKKKDKRQTLKFVIFSSSVFVVCLSLAIVCERYNFDFGYDDHPVNKSFFSEIESTKERNVSISVCYSLCKILKENQKMKENDCNNETLIKYTFSDLDKMTWNKDDFKRRTSLRNSMKIIPIRQDDWKLPVYFRNFRKCFLIYYRTLNVLPHLPLQRKSQIYLKFEPHEDNPKDKVRDYDYFIIEDGNKFTYPKLNAIYSKKSVLHNVQIYYERYKCVNSFKHQNITYKKDEIIQECLIKKYLETKNGLPIFTNFKLYNNQTMDLYGNFKFINETSLDEQLLKECHEKYPQKECLSTKTSITDQELFKDVIGNITVNLTPFLYEIKYFESENRLVVFNRIISFLCLFTCFSVCNTIKNFSCTYLYSLVTVYGFRVVKKFSYLLGFILFVIHLSLLSYEITHSITKTYSNELMKTIEFPRFRICYEHQFNLIKTFSELREDDVFNETILNKHLERNTLNFTDLIDKIIIHHDQNNQEEITNENGTQNLQVFYIDNLKCFNFNILKKYYLSNANIPKLERLIEFHINLTRPVEKRVFFFLGGENMLNFDANKPFNTGITTIDYLTKEYIFDDKFWYLKNCITYFLNQFGYKIVKNFPVDFEDRISQQFSKDQFATTTSVFLNSLNTTNDSRRDLPIKNKQFNSYINFKSIDLVKVKDNEYIFDENGKFMSYSMVVYEEGKQLEPQNITHLYLRSNLIKIVTLHKNTYNYFELVLNGLILMKFYFKFNIIYIPELIKSSFPTIKFIVFLTLYLIVVFILFLFECWFRFIKFLDIKHA